MTQSVQLLVRGGTVYTPDGPLRADIAIDNGTITSVSGAADMPVGADRELDATGLSILPGIWHPHCHFRDPGLTHKEDFESGTRAAVAGGVTFCLDQINTEPHPTTVANFELKRSIVEPKAHVDFGLYAGGLHPTEMPGLARAGAMAFKIFNTRHPKDAYPYIPELGVTDHGHMYEIFEAAAATGLVVAVHHDDTDWTRRMVFRDYIDAGRIDNSAYMEAYEKGYMYGHGMVAGLAASLYYARLAGVRLYVLHVGVMPVGAYELLEHAKRTLRQEVYAEMELTAMLMDRAQAEKVGPRTYLWAHSPDAAWDAMARGIPDVLQLEHAPHRIEEVDPGWQDNFTIPLGITGIQEFLPLLLTEVNRGRVTLENVARLCSENPARIFGLYPRKGAIAPGSDADLTIVDMHREGVLTASDMHSKAGFTSWEGKAVTAMPVYTVVRGNVAMDHGKVLSKPGTGRFTPGIGQA